MSSSVSSPARSSVHDEMNVAIRERIMTRVKHYDPKRRTQDVFNGVLQTTYEVVDDEVWIYVQQHLTSVRRQES